MVGQETVFMTDPCTNFTHTLQIEQLKQQNAALQHECKVKSANCEAEVLRLRTEVYVIRCVDQRNFILLTCTTLL